MTQTLISSVRKNWRQSHYLPKWIKMAQDEAHRTKLSKIKKKKKKFTLRWPLGRIGQAT